MHQYLRHLANFARIVEAGSMKAASDLIGLAPSGLSDSVKILENRVGSPLLVRHKDGVTPTSEGERIYDAAEGIVALLDEALQTKDGDALSGPCRLSIPTEVANFAMAPVIGQLAAQHPGLKLSIFAEDEVVDHARFGRDYFLRIASKPRDQEGLRVLWTAKVTAILVASSKFVKEHQKDNIDDLSKIPLITNAKSNRLRWFLNRQPACLWQLRAQAQQLVSTSAPLTRSIMGKCAIFWLTGSQYQFRSICSRRTNGRAA